MFSEPTLKEMLDDPVVRLLMHRDGIHPDDVRHVMRAIMKA
ncbi:hypothetical protein PQU92_09700 [Asticcacaulis sp. BYS171W]|uniref:Uncharacterized protein n=1 Tax=Asticcacaulis aquaticus TaxID=2984212 RepID=A0ABT5HU10_9CAUL|nr:hypothetical protein [Asticcacaulis aquaticus]MDC7683550.1 hypothetical protein [Asticcacaulis aquaticus]